MEIDPLQSSDDNTSNAKHARLNTWVAITVALLATFMGICKVKDDNIVQAMQQSQADKVDHWGWYQAHDTREAIFEATLATLKAQNAGDDVMKPIEERAKAQTDKKAKAREDAEND